MLIRARDFFGECYELERELKYLEENNIYREEAQRYRNVLRLTKRLLRLPCSYENRGFNEDSLLVMSDSAMLNINSIEKFVQQELSRITIPVAEVVT